MEIKKITKEEGTAFLTNWSMWDEDAPISCFYWEDDSQDGYTWFIGCDNSTNDCWVEEFATEEMCIKWLSGELDIDEINERKEEEE